MRPVLIYLLMIAVALVIVHQAARTVSRPVRVNPRHELLENL